MKQLNINMKKSLQSTFLIIFSIAVIASVTSCNKSNNTLPLPAPVINPIVSQLSSTSATIGGRSGASTYVTENGICYSATNSVPTVSDIHIVDTLAARWQHTLIGLTPNTTYYVRVYQRNDSGVGYSDVVTFKTNATDAVPTGTVTTFAGSATGASGYIEGTGTAALFDGPLSIAFSPVSGSFYVNESFNNTIRSLSTAGTTSSYFYSAIGYVDGAQSAARFYGPRGMSFDAQGNTYLADLGNNVIRKISSTNTVSTIAGNTISGYIDGAANKAEFYNPSATAVDAAGNVYVADRTNNLIRKITPAGVVSVLAGFRALNGFPQSTVPGYLDGAAATAVFNYPVALTFDASGNLYVADYKNSAIRKVTPAGDVTTYAGGPDFPAFLGNPTGLVMDKSNNLFISENNGRILEITAGKVLYILAGANASGYVNGVGSAARFGNPQSITLDAQGNLYVADFNNNAIRKITVAVQ